MRLPLLTLLTLGACDRLPAQNIGYNPGLVDGLGALAGADGVYVPLPKAGKIALVSPEGAALLDFGFGVVQSIAPAPAGRVAAFVHTFRCVADDPRELRGVDEVRECGGAGLETEAELLVLDGATGSIRF